MTTMLEIHGGGFKNKGAELMLRTVVRTLAADGTRFCVEPEHDSPYRQRASLELAQLVPPVSRYRQRRYPYLMRFSRLVGPLVPASLCSTYGLVRPGDTHGLIDISGYAFGDHWPTTHLSNFALKAEDYKKKGKPVVLMPQMLGPFAKPEIADQFKRIVDTADLVFAREDESYRVARELLGENPKLRQAPDITIFSPPGPEHAAAVPDHPYACLVPNVRMLDKGGSEWKDVYIDRMTKVAHAMLERGVRPVLVVHDASGKDEGLADQLAGSIGTDRCDHFRHTHPLVLKSFIAGSRCLVGSRFHSIVAAFASGVPAVALGWAHKYAMLAKDFGCPDLLHKADLGDEHLLGLVHELIDEQSRQARVEKIRAAKQAMQPANDEMWREVRQALKLDPA